MDSLKNIAKKRAVILKKPSGTISISGNLDARERKLYNMLLKVAEESLKQNPQQHIFITTLTELKQALNVKEDDKHNANYKEIIKNMSNVKLEYNILEKDRYIEGFAHLLDDVEFIHDKTTKSVIVKYYIPERVRLSIISKNGIYANINLMIIKGLQSKYSIILYEIVRDYQNVEIPQMPMEKFRKIFGIEEKYHRIDHLKSRVLDVAVNELNNNENIDFFVGYELIKTGRVYTHIKFKIKPKPAKLKSLQSEKAMLENKVNENEELQELLSCVPRAYRKTQKVVSILLASLRDKGKSYTMAQVEYCAKQYDKDKVKNFIAFLKKAIEEDYAAFEKLDIDVYTILEDAPNCRFSTVDNERYIITSVDPVKGDPNKFIVHATNLDTKYNIRFPIPKANLLNIIKRNKELEE